MDISRYFRSVARFLIKHASEPDVDFYTVDRASSQWVSVVSCKYADRQVSGTGVGESRVESFIKAIAELGEAIIKNEKGLASRSGVAGGLIHSNVLIRAKAELVERDAFLRHYRKKIPFQFCPDDTKLLHNELRVFRLDSAVDEFQVALVTSKSQSAEGQNYVGFGTGAHISWKVAVAKAVDEFHATNHFIAQNIERIQSLLKSGEMTLNPIDRHLFACFDVRNLQIFSSLCSESESAPASKSCYRAQSEWEISEFESPVRFFRFLRVMHPALQAIEFGVPEFTNGQPLYHPFW